MYIYNYHVSPQPLTSLPTFDSLTTFDLLYNLWPLVQPNISHLDVLPWSEANLSSILSIGLPLSLLPPNLAAVVTFSSCPLMSPKNVYCLTREINVYSQIVSAISMTLFHLSVVFALSLHNMLHTNSPSCGKQLWLHPQRRHLQVSVVQGKLHLLPPRTRTFRPGIFLVYPLSVQVQPRQITWTPTRYQFNVSRNVTLPGV